MTTEDINDNFSNYAIFDKTALVTLLGDDVDSHKIIINKYLSTTPELIIKLHQALDTKDLESIKNTAHTLKSSTRSVGGVKSGELFAKMEQDAKNSNFDSINTASEYIDKYYNELVTQIKSDI